MLKRFYYILSVKVEECSIDFCSGQIIRKEWFFFLFDAGRTQSICIVKE